MRIIRKEISITAILAGALFMAVFLMPFKIAAADQPFRFENMQSLIAMEQFLEREFTPGETSREDLRRVFVEEGGATLKQHPTRAHVEKYIYDINLCSYYIWRWNISADYDQDGKLVQLYMNGKNDQRVQDLVQEKTPGQDEAIYKAQRPRPEAHKGEKSLAFIVYDKDSDVKTIDDQVAIGAGPSRPDPMNMGKVVAYKEIDPWRSIFDQDAADKIVPYEGNCDQVDRYINTLKQNAR